MTVEIKKGTPPCEGQYVAFVNGDNGFVQAKMITWHGGRWHYWRPVYAWIGPIPVLTVEQLQADPAPTQEFDL